MNTNQNTIKKDSLGTYFFKNGSVNDVLLTTAEDKTMTAYAVYYKRKIKTERMVTIDLSENPTANRITKVTILK